ncbi:MAG: hypothetical protein WDN25_04820 [Acetobacteraceae bacterium]
MGSEVSALYDRLGDRILSRDQAGASEAYYGLLRAGRPMPEIMARAVHIHAPYTHVPYHQRIDDGVPNFVNNDHCLLSARASLHLANILPGPLAALPMAQTIWYIPSALDIWNQKILKAPGHYAPRDYQMPETPPQPAIYWQDQEPLRDSAPLATRLGHWLTLVERGQVLDAYRVFLGLMEEKPHRRDVLAELVFAGMIDVQDRLLFNRSYTTGHKAYRARATVEVGNAIGWDNAHDVIYAGALDIAVGPRWYSTYEMACNVVTIFLEGQTVSAIPYRGTTERERALLGNTQPLSEAETATLLDALLYQHEPAYIRTISELLLAGRSPRRIIDVLQLAAAQIILQTRHPNNFGHPQHCYEYCNTLGWFYDNFEHPHRLKLLYVGAAFVNRTAWSQNGIGECQPHEIAAAAGADRLSAAQMLERLEASVLACDTDGSAGWTKAYLASGGDRGDLVRHLALLSARLGNDPHNQEIPGGLLQDYATNQSPHRDRLLLTCAFLLAGARRYGDAFEASRRFETAMQIA